jgi:tripartite-type tricarboxylate transporter receptor subunit TctC
MRRILRLMLTGKETLVEASSGPSMHGKKHSVVKPRTAIHWRIRATAAAVVAFVLWPKPSEAQYPIRPIKIIVPLAPGGSADVIARVVADRLGRILNQSVVVENRAGAGGAIGASAVSRAQPDGYTLLLATSSTATLSLFSKSVAFQIEKDLEPISLLFKSPLYVVSNSAVPATSLPALVSFSKQNQQPINFATTGLGAARLWLEHFNRNNGVSWTNVTYRGGGPAVQALLANEVQLMAGTYENYQSYIDAGKIRALAVLTNQRSQEFPNIPTAEESGLSSLDVTFWVGLLAPIGTAKEVVARLGRASVEAVNSGDVLGRLRTLGMEPVGSSPEEFASYIQQTVTRLTAAAHDAGIKPE